MVPLLAALGCGAAPPASGPAPTPPAAARPDAPPLARAERAALQAQARAAYDQKSFAACAALFAQTGAHYDAACCLAQDGQRDAAFAALGRALDGSDPPSLAHLDRDTDLSSLHPDPRWAAARGQLEARTAARRARQNAELRQLHDDDQADRSAGSHGQIDWAKVAPRDQARRKRVAEILAAGGAKIGDDYFHAAMVYQHGDTPDDYQRAHDLASKAVELDPGNAQARWLAAASEDRKLMAQDQPQKWGTQYKKVDGVWILWRVDPSITDEQREAWNVPPLAEAQARAAQMNAQPAR